MALEKFVSLFSRHRHITTDNNNDYIITDANLKDNIPKGKHLEPKQEEHTRLWCSNIYGLQYDNMEGKITDVLTIAKETQADILAVLEHNTDTIQYDIQSS